MGSLTYTTAERLRMKRQFLAGTAYIGYVYDHAHPTWTFHGIRKCVAIPCKLADLRAQLGLQEKKAQIMYKLLK